MNIQDATKKAIAEDKEMALPPTEQCVDGGYRLRLKPFPNNIVLLEFYGVIRKIDRFSLSSLEIMSDDWIVL